MSVGKDLFSWARTFEMPFAVSRALLPGAWYTSRQEARFPSTNELLEKVNLPSSTLATSLRYTRSPVDGTVLTITFSKSETLLSRPLTRIPNSNVCVCCWGGTPAEPAATCTFCALSAEMTSVGVKLYDAIFSGSIQMRILKSSVNLLMLPTPGTRSNASCTKMFV